MFDNQQFGVGIPRLGLRAYKRQKGFGNDDISLNTAIF